jgi:hypothetical protein
MEANRRTLAGDRGDRYEHFLDLKAPCLPPLPNRAGQAVRVPSIDDRRPAALLRGPLADSNRRPHPYHPCRPSPRAASLAHGVPLVSLPNLAADQPALAARVAALGAGRVLDGESASPDDIADAAATVLADPSYVAAARRLAKAVAAASGPAGTASRIEGLAHHSPLLT